MTRRTVLFVQGGGERAGAERVLLTLLRHLDRDRFRPVVVFYAAGPFVEEVRSAGVEVVERFPTGRLRDLVRIPSVVRDLRAVIERVRPDVVQATGEKMSVYAGWATRGLGIPTVFWLHDSPWSTTTGDAGTLATQVAMALTPRTSVVTCAGWLGEAVSRRYRMPAVAIPNGVELDRLPAPGAHRAEVLGLAGWDGDAVVFGHFARLQRWKGTDVFLRAAAHVAARHPAARFLVVGDAMFGQDEAWAAGLPALAAELGLGDRVHFAGYRADALALMSSVDGVVHCSLRPDPFPTVVLEGMCLGRAVVATRVNGPEEMLEHGRSGLLADPADVASLAAALDELAGSPERRRALGAAAAEVAHDRFDADRYAADFEAHWDGLLAGSPASPGVTPGSPGATSGRRRVAAAGSGRSRRSPAVKR